MTDALVNVALMRLTQDADSSLPVSEKVHPKHLRRLRELRLRQPLPARLLVELSHFTGLKQLYLDRGADSLATLEAIPKHLCTAFPLPVIVGLSYTIPRPLFPERPELETLSLHATSVDAPLRVEDASTATLVLSGKTAVPDFTQWPHLTQLDLRMEPGSAAKKLRTTSTLTDLTVRCARHCSLVRRRPHASVPSMAFSSGLLGGATVCLDGELEGFESLLVLEKTAFRGEPLTGLETLSIFCEPLGTKEIERYLTVAPAVPCLATRFEEGTDYAAIATAHRHLKKMQLSLADPAQIPALEKIGARVHALGCEVEATTSGGAFRTLHYRSATGKWWESIDR